MLRLKCNSTIQSCLKFYPTAPRRTYRWRNGTNAYQHTLPIYVFRVLDGFTSMAPTACLCLKVALMLGINKGRIIKCNIYGHLSASFLATARPILSKGVARIFSGSTLISQTLTFCLLFPSPHFSFPIPSQLLTLS